MCICERIWLSFLEPLFRFWSTYPPDWQQRRLLVFERAQGRCEVCGIPAGRIEPTENGWKVIGAHVHHAKPIARGGRHGWGNLKVLCVGCHRRAHPHNSELGRRPAFVTPRSHLRHAHSLPQYRRTSPV